jgi:hypothetical protein
MPDSVPDFDRLATGTCQRCGDEVAIRWLDDGICVGCRERREPVPDGGSAVEGCWYCDLDQWHPTCDRPGCEVNVHGFGPDGKRTTAYCRGHRSTPPAATDGGRDRVTIEDVIDTDKLAGDETDEVVRQITAAYVNALNDDLDPAVAAGAVVATADALRKHAGVPTMDLLKGLADSNDMILHARPAEDDDDEVLPDGGRVQDDRRLSYVERCRCGSTVIGYQSGDECPDCGTVIHE